MNSSILSSLLRGASIMALAASAAQAQVFSYDNTRDTLLAFRQSGAGASGNDLIVNLGSIAQFRTMSGGSFSVATGSLVSSVFNGTAGLGNLQWSVSSGIRASSELGLPVQTLFLTRPRTDINVQTDSWIPRSSGQQGLTAGNIASMGSGAVSFGTGLPSAIISNGYLSTPDFQSFSPQLRVGSGSNGGGTSGNFRNTFSSSGTSGANVELTTSSNFGVSSPVVRADFFELQPSASTGTYLGYFEMSGNGNVSFTPVPEPSDYAALGAVGLAAFAVWRRKNASR
jgi:hypothetical protein